MSAWQGAHMAPGYSRDVEAAYNAVKAAEAELLKSLQESYPLNMEVKITHWNGHFYGVITGWDHHGARVQVRNTYTGKTSKWWAAHVEAIPK